MKYYITPDKVNDCRKRLERIFSKLEKKPNVAYSDIKQVVQTKGVVYEASEFDGGSQKYIYKRVIDVVEVVIDDFTFKDWTIVAQVCYNEGFITMVDGRFYKSIPQKYGLKYNRCDHCGGTHSSRKMSYIVYNQKTGEWMQVGSTCIDKMAFDGKYFAKIVTKLVDIFVCKLFGSGEEGFGSWRVADHYAHMAIPFRVALATCKHYYDNISKDWIKVTWEKGIRFSGTNDYLREHIGKITDTIVDENENFFIDVCNYVMSLKVESVDTEISEYSEETLEQKMQRAIEQEYIKISEMFIAYFAMKAYLDSFKREAFLKLIQENGIRVGEKFTFVGNLSTIKKESRWNEYYECYDEWKTAVFVSDNGIEFRKRITDESVIDSYKIEGSENRYEFCCMVKYIPTKANYVGLGGRFSKVKKTTKKRK